MRCVELLDQALQNRRAVCRLLSQMYTLVEESWVHSASPWCEDES